MELIITVLQLYATILATKIIVDFMGLSTENPLGKTANALTDPLLNLIKRLSEHMKPIIAGLILLFFVSFVISFFTFSKTGFIGILIHTVPQMLLAIVYAYILMLTAVVLLRLLKRNDALYTMLDQATTPITSKLKMIPPVGGMDISPVVAIIVLVIVLFVIGMIH